MNTYNSAFQLREDLQIYDDNALLLFALETKFGIEDIQTVASNALTDAKNDKGCDLVYVDRDYGHAVIGQGYFAQTEKSQAPANKASSLNTAIGWLLGRDLNDIPVEVLRNATVELHDALNADHIDSLHIWYVHNLPESKSIEQELITVERNAKALLEKHFPKLGELEVTATEVGNETIEEWYRSRTTPILVTKTFNLRVPGGYEIETAMWKAFITSISARRLHEMYSQHPTELFSANIRGYLGSRQSRNNINNSIKETVAEEPENFWVYNNGLTALVHKYAYDSQSKELIIEGISIVNGAQTTGAIGSLNHDPIEDTFVSARFIVCNDDATIRKIIKFNNTQNRVEAADFRSNDPIQTRLVKEFEKISNATYFGGRRENKDDIIKRHSDLLPSYTVAQALAAFHLNPVVAYNQKSQLWLNNNLYQRYFNEKTTAEHIVFTFSLLRAIEEFKRQLVEKERNEKLTESDHEKLVFIKSRGANFLFLSAISACIEVIIGNSIENRFRLSFGNTSPKNAQKHWFPIVELTASFSAPLNEAMDLGRLKSQERAQIQIKQFRSFVEATASANQDIFEKVAKKIKIS